MLYLCSMSSPTPMPFIFVVALILGFLLMVASFLILFVFPGKEIGKQIPAWVQQLSSPIFMLSLPVVMLLVTMLLFPCFWQHCR